MRKNVASVAGTGVLGFLLGRRGEEQKSFSDSCLTSFSPSFY